MAHFVDLSISKSNENISKKLEMAARLGFSTVAVNCLVDDSIGKGKKKEKPSPMPQPEQYSLSTDSNTDKNRLEVLSRVTFVLSDPAQVVNLQRNPIIQKYDILAVRPTNEKMFHLACTQLEVDIISLDFTERLPFYIKRPSTGPAIERGVHFEICYAPMIRDSTARKNIISNAQSLANVGKGKNLILSSDCDKVLEMRGPYDAANLATLFGINEAKAKAMVSSNCRSVIMHARARKSAKYVMTVQLTSSLPEDELWKVKQLQNDSKELTDIERTDNSTTVDYKTNETDSRELEPASKRLKVAN